MITIFPKSLEGTIMVPSSKSIGHRMFICAALADGESIIENVHMSKDIEVTIEALKAIGADIQPLGELSWAVRGLSVKSQKMNETAHKVVLFCGESGSTLRFMIPVATAVSSHNVFNGENRLVERPIDEFFPILEKSGAKLLYQGQLPLEVMGRLKAGEYGLAGHVSSQYTSGILLASPLLEGDTSVDITSPMESKAYIDLTIDVMNTFNVSVQREGYSKFFVEKDQSYQPRHVQVEGDYSQAAFWIVAGVIGNLPIKLQGMREDSMQGDRVILDIVSSMGGQLYWEADGLLVLPSKTTGRVIDASQCPDLVPILAVLCALSEGESRIINGLRLRLKESDRITSTVTELRKLGAMIIETEDGMIIEGDALQSFLSAELDSWNDHRIAMAMAIAATRAEGPIGIRKPSAVMKSYPKFFEDYIQLGGEIHGEYHWQ